MPTSERYTFPRKVCHLELYKYFGARCSSDIIGFHAFTGCDNTGKFARRSKEICFKKFDDADDDVLNT